MRLDFAGRGCRLRSRREEKGGSGVPQISIAKGGGEGIAKEQGRGFFIFYF